MKINGPFVYQLGHGPLKAERWVRFPYGLQFTTKYEPFLKIIIRGFMVSAGSAGGLTTTNLGGQKAKSRTELVLVRGKGFSARGG